MKAQLLATTHMLSLFQAASALRSHERNHAFKQIHSRMGGGRRLQLGFEGIHGDTMEEVCASVEDFYSDPDNYQTHCACSGTVRSIIEVSCRDTCEFLYPNGSRGVFSSSAVLVPTRSEEPDAPQFSSWADEGCCNFLDDVYGGVSACIQGYYKDEDYSFGFTIDGVACTSLQLEYGLLSDDVCYVGDCSNVGLPQPFSDCQPETLVGGPLEVTFGEDEPLVGVCPPPAPPVAASVPFTSPAAAPVDQDYRNGSPAGYGGRVTSSPATTSVASPIASAISIPSPTREKSGAPSIWIAYSTVGMLAMSLWLI